MSFHSPPQNQQSLSWFLFIVFDTLFPTGVPPQKKQFVTISKNTISYEKLREFEM